MENSKNKLSIPWVTCTKCSTAIQLDFLKDGLCVFCGCDLSTHIGEVGVEKVLITNDIFSRTIGF